MNDPTIDHAFITRFNVPTPGRESLIRAREGWLRQRVELFDTFCLPSVIDQSNRNFRWLVYFDPESPEWFMDWIRKHESRGSFHPLFRISISNNDLVADLRSITGGHGDVLMTTNLDNDDALAIDFVERLQAAIQGSTRTAIYFQHGAILRSSKLYLRRDRHNAFCTVAEPWKHPVTAWNDWHNRLVLSMPATILGGNPAWLQVVHGSNVSNAVHGTLTRPRSLSGSFPHALAALPDPEPWEVLVDFALWRPVRGMKTIVRRSVKYVALAILGRDGFDRLKNLVSERTNRRRRLKLSPTISPSVAGQGPGTEN